MMRMLHRTPLSNRATAFLKKRTEKVAGAGDPKKEADRLWSMKNNMAFDEIRKTLAEMASGNERCMYCEDSAGSDIDHFRPKALYPLYAYTWSNYLTACGRCNSNYKRDEFPLDDKDAPLLIDPTSEDPRSHLGLSLMTGKVVALSPKGRESARVYGLGRRELEKGRAANKTAFEALLEKYGRARERGEADEAERVKQAIFEMPHSSVFTAIIDTASGDNADLFLSRECLDVIEKHPEVREWLG